MCFGSLIWTEVNSASISNMISDPYVSKEIRRECIVGLLSALSQWAKDDGAVVVNVCSRFESLQWAAVDRCGFSVYDENVKIMGKGL